MNILGCLDTPTSGSYLFQGVDVGSLNRNQRALLRRHYLGFVFQGFNLLNRTSALENVELPLIYRGTATAIRHRLAREALRAVGLSDRENHTPASCPVASNNALPSPAPLSPDHRCCWRTNHRQSGFSARH